MPQSPTQSATQHATQPATRPTPGPAPQSATLPTPPGSRWRRLLPLLGLVLLIVVLARLDRHALAAAFGRLSLWTVPAAAAAFLANVALKAVRWRRLLDAQSIALPWRVAVGAFFAAAFYGAITPGRVGELARVGVLTARGVPLGRGVASCIFDRVLDLATLVTVGGVFGAAWLGEPALALALGLLTLIGVPAGRALLLYLSRRAHGASPASRAGRLLRDLALASPPMLTPRALGEALAWTVVAWVGYYGAVAVLASGMGLSVTLPALVAATSAAALTALLPVTFQGIGTRELVFAFALGREGVPAEAAVALSLAALGTFLAASVLSGGLALVSGRGGRAG